MKTLQKGSGVNLFNYTDYRKYLSDYYKARKKIDPAFSYRYFAKRAGIQSSGFYKELVDGKRGLSRALLLKFAQALQLTKRETSYFENMVYFNDAKSVDERKIYFRRMMAAYDSSAFKIHSTHYEYFARWYYVAIRELLSFCKIKDQANLLATELNPSIRPDQAEKAIRVLEKLGLIGRDKNGYYSRKNAVLTTGQTSENRKIDLLNLINFQKEMMRLAGEAYDRFPLSQLNMSSLSLSVSGQTYQAIKEEIADFRKKLLAMAEKDEKPDRVCQVNYQMFPLTKIEEGGK